MFETGYVLLKHVITLHQVMLQPADAMPARSTLWQTATVYICDSL
jgi:hypothetical protein